LSLANQQRYFEGVPSINCTCDKTNDNILRNMGVLPAQLSLALTAVVISHRRGIFEFS
jgi:hypothetical protein